MENTLIEMHKIVHIFLEGKLIITLKALKARTTYKEHLQNPLHAKEGYGPGKTLWAIYSPMAIF